MIKMPYKDRKKRLAYMEKYNKKRASRKARLEKAILEGDLKEARQILKTKLSVSLGEVIA